MVEQTFKPFHETYPFVSLTMGLGVMYPNPKTNQFRRNVIVMVYLSACPASYMLLADIYECWKRRDILNIIRHNIIIVPFLLVLLKMALMYINRTEVQHIIDEINSDHLKFNSLPESYQNIARHRINWAVFSEKCWVVNVLHCVLVFPFMSIVETLYDYLIKGIPQRHMIHDLNFPNTDPEVRFESPYFELTYVYMSYICMVLLLNFIGYDGLYGISINHACLKMHLYCKAMEDAMNLTDKREIFDGIVRVILDQNKLFRFVDAIQVTFNVWLGCIFLGTVIHVCNCMYQIMEGYGLDMRYMVFIIGSVIHIYLPCRYAAKLKTKSEDTATEFYSCGWENVNDQRIRYMLLFMIARAQIPLTITAFNIVCFDMELFVSILRTSYSLFTLLRS